MTLPRYIYELPYSARSTLCDMLDSSGAWQHIASSLFRLCDITRFRLASLHPDGSPTDRFLTEWGHRNASVSDLYCRLAALGLDECLRILQDYVPEETRNSVEVAASSENQPGATASNGASSPLFTSELPLPLPSFDFKKQADNSSTPYSPNLPAGCSMNGSSQSIVSCSDNVSYDDSCQNVRPNILSDDETVVTVEKKPQNKLQNCQQADCMLLPCALNDLSDVPGSALSSTHHFKYDDIKKATNSFDPSNLIGQGGFGLVYKGFLKNTYFAFKQLKSLKNLNSQFGMRQHIVEMETLLRFRHENIIQLCGYSMDGEKLCLAFQFMDNGSLHDRLACKDNTAPLTWRQRHNILRGAARGIQYLHTVMDKPLIHGDIKSANILLDRSFEAKVSDFGLAKQATSATTGSKLTHVTCSQEPIFGSEAYLPDEFFSCYHYSVKTDSFSFGVVIFETCTGKKVWDSHNNIYLKDEMQDLCKLGVERLLYLRDSSASTWPSQKWLQLLALGMDLTSRTQKARPHMEQVLRRLDIMETYLLVPGGQMSQGQMSENRVSGQHMFCDGSNLNSFASTVHHPSPIQLQRNYDLLNIQQEERKRRMEDTYRQVADMCKPYSNGRQIARTAPHCTLSEKAGEESTCKLLTNSRGLENPRHTICTVPEDNGGKLNEGNSTADLPNEVYRFDWQTGVKETKYGDVLDIYCTQGGTFTSDENSTSSVQVQSSNKNLPALDQTDTAIIRMKKCKKQPSFLEFDDDDD